MEYRKFLADELEEVAKLHDQMVYYIQREARDEYWDFEELPAGNTKRHLQAFLHHAGRKIFIAKENGKIIGFIAGKTVQCHLPISSIKEVGYISGAYVLPPFRGKGIMKNLEKMLVEFFRDCGLKYLELHFIPKNLSAKKSWEALGYRTFREQARKKI